MQDDPVIQAVRDVRHQISESVGHDPQKLLENYQKRQERYKDRLVHGQSYGSGPNDLFNLKNAS